MKSPLLIIIVHWNTPRSLRTLLTLLKLTNNYQIIVADNASKESVEWIKKDFPDVQLIHNKFNRGYASACNQGVLKSVGLARRSFNEGGEWVLFLNPDVEMTPQQIEEMLDYAEKNYLDACSVKTDESYNKPLPSWLSLLVEFTPLNRFISQGVFGKKTLFGGCLLIRKKVFESLGGWDERFFLWFEDSDLTLRLIQSNFKIGWAPVVVKHKGGESFKLLENQLQRDIFFHSMDIYAKKHFSFFGKMIVSLIKHRYTKRKLLPSLSEGTSVTVPNMKMKNLANFFENNNQIVTISYYTSGVQWIVVTSSIVNSDIWEWRRKYPDIRFIPIEKNYGFASTVNVGFRASSGKWIGTINDDVIMKKNELKNLLICAEKSTGSINPVIKKIDGSTESIGIKVLPRGKAAPIKSNQFDNGPARLATRSVAGRRAELVPKSCFEVDSTNAAAVIYSKDALNKVGLFDEKFGSYLEDVDLSLRLKRAGYKNIVSLRSKVKHIGQSTSKDLGIKKQYYDFRNWIYVILKNWGLKELILNFPSIFTERLRNISGILKILFLN